MHPRRSLKRSAAAGTKTTGESCVVVPTRWQSVPAGWSFSSGVVEESVVRESGKLVTVAVVGLLAGAGCPNGGPGGEPAPDVVDGGDASPADTNADAVDRTDAASADTGAACSSDSDCEGSVCDPVDNVCVECTESQHCSTPDPICRDHRCTGCTSDDHCPSGERCQNNACAATELAIKPSTLRMSATVGTTRSSGISVVNEGDATVGVTDLRIEEETGGNRDERREFHEGGDWTRTFELQSGEQREFVVEYAPVNEQDDRGAFVVVYGSGEIRATLEGLAN